MCRLLRAAHAGWVPFLVMPLGLSRVATGLLDGSAAPEVSKFVFSHDGIAPATGCREEEAFEEAGSRINVVQVAMWVSRRDRFGQVGQHGRHYVRNVAQDNAFLS